MKRAWLVTAFSLTLAGFGVGCGPEEKYCYDQHSTCRDAKLAEQAKKDEQAQEAARKAEEERLRRLDAGLDH